MHGMNQYMTRDETAAYIRKHFPVGTQVVIDGMGGKWIVNGMAQPGGWGSALMVVLYRAVTSPPPEGGRSLYHRFERVQCLSLYNFDEKTGEPDMSLDELADNERCDAEAAKAATPEDYPGQERG